MRFTHVLLMAFSCTLLNLCFAQQSQTRDPASSPQQALERVEAFDPELLIVPYGADTYVGDPISFFSIETADYTEMARMIAALGKPTLICMEGGYALDALGANVSAFLKGFEG